LSADILSCPANPAEAPAKLLRAAATSLTAVGSRTVRWIALHPEQFSHNGGIVKRRSSDRGEAAKTLVRPAAVGVGLAAAADRIGPLVHQAADRVAPLAQTAADRIAPLAQQTAGRISPVASQAAGYVGPYAQQAAGYVTPIALLAAARVAPLAESAKLHSVQLAHGAVEVLTPRFEVAWERVVPVVDAANHRVTDEFIPRVNSALAAAAASPIAVEASRRGRATLAAARGELQLPEPQVSRTGTWVKRFAVVVALGGAAAFAAKQLLGSKDADWQAARPTVATAPSTAAPAGTAGGTETTGTAAATQASETDGPLDWAVATGQADPDPLDPASEQRIVEHVDAPSDMPAEASPSATVAEKPADSDIPMSEAPRTADASESNMPERDGKRTTE
jgi:hypothetical protein